ncbi:glycosyltransferase family 2 protein [Vibrio agarivorans]|uniref:glycosyltransferase family 2 protein n=1 Tax=Vibrio agarivorans TaxID=153622 RepID=UPI00222EB1E0|nr:glycosyltransferase family 2 protein [Vibrio agarivorans]
MDKKVKVVAISKDESRYLPEWVAHHAYFGFDEFDIYINNTTDNSIEVLYKVVSKLNVKVNVIPADEMFKQYGSSFQVEAYKHAINNTSEDEFSHVAFLDIDEFWTPKCFSLNIKDYISIDESYDVYLFNWAIKCNESEFSPCFDSTNRFLFDKHVKCVVKLGKSVSPLIHNVTGPGLKYANGQVLNASFIDKDRAKVNFDNWTEMKAFVVHRLYRSEMEYISLLGRGRPRGDRFKTNRTGYFSKNQTFSEFNIDSVNINNYTNFIKPVMEHFETTGLKSKAEGFVLERYNKLLQTIQQGVSISESKVLVNAMRNVGIPEVSVLKDKLDGGLRELRIFQIGFNKSGTASIFHYLQGEGLASVHWDSGKLSKKIKHNYEHDISLLSGYEGFQVFTDIEHREADNSAFYSGEVYFRDLDKQYPGSIFILNFRNIDKWISSRINHPDYLSRTMRSSGMNESQVVEFWKRRYHGHISEVIDYFKDKDNLIILDLDHDDDEKLYRELRTRGVFLKNRKLPHSHKTNERQLEKERHIDAVRDAAIHFEKLGDIRSAYSLMKIAHYLRPAGPLIKDKLNKLEAELTKDDQVR